MNRHGGIWMAGVVVALGLTGMSQQAAAPSGVPVTVFLQTASDAQRLDAAVIHAEKEVTRIYERIGVNVLWVDGGRQPTLA
jgi:prepilin-type processing-associated H-X9-DG protein